MFPDVVHVPVALLKIGKSEDPAILSGPMMSSLATQEAGFIAAKVDLSCLGTS